MKHFGISKNSKISWCYVLQIYYLYDTYFVITLSVDEMIAKHICYE